MHVAKMGQLEASTRSTLRQARDQVVLRATAAVSLVNTVLPPLLHACAHSAGFIDVRTVPALKTTTEGGSGQLAAWLVPMWVLCVAFWVTAGIEARQVLRHYEGDKWLMVSTGGYCVNSS